MRHYIGILHKEAGSDYGISFPDLPGAVTAAASLDEAVEMAAEALALHVEGLLAEGATVPEPSNLERLRAEHRGDTMVVVPLKTDNLAMRVQVTLPAPVLRRIDKHIEAEGQTRSGFLTEAAKEVLAQERTSRKRKRA
jgi:predicted RNase H-like HicB family nuclease